MFPGNSPPTSSRISGEVQTDMMKKHLIDDIKCDTYDTYDDFCDWLWDNFTSNFISSDIEFCRLMGVHCAKLYLRSHLLNWHWPSLVVACQHRLNFGAGLQVKVL